MADQGLLDMLMGNGGGTAGAMDPRAMGLLGMAGAMGQAYTPQPASRLPLAQPNMAYMLGQAAGGYGQGYGAGMNQQNLQAQTQGQLQQNYGTGLQNYMNTQNYNLTAPYFGQPSLPPPTMPGAAIQSPNGRPPMPIPEGGGGGDAPAMPSLPPPQAPVPMPPPGAAPGAMGAPPGAPAPMPPPQGQAAPNLMELYKNVPPPILQMRGIQVPPELTAAYFAGVQVGTPEWNNVANAALLKTAGIKSVIGGERPGDLPKYYNMGTGKYEADTSQLPTMEAAAAAQARGTAGGQYPFKVAESWETQRARIDAEKKIAANQYTLRTGEQPPGGAPTPSMAGPSEPIITPKGTAVPSPTKQVIGPGEEQIKSQLTNSAKTEENWNSIRASLEPTEDRLIALAKAYQTVKPGGLTEQRAQISNNLRGLGMDKFADMAMNAKDTAAVQQAQWLAMQDVLGTLKNINAGTGGRILNSEFNAFLEHGFSSNMRPEALHAAIGQQLGSLYQTRNMIDDYTQVGRPGGWRDANQFQSNYLSQDKNKMGGFVKQAEEKIGLLKGMPGAGPSQDDVDYTAKKHGITADEVRRRLLNGQTMRPMQPTPAWSGAIAPAPPPSPSSGPMRINPNATGLSYAP